MDEIINKARKLALRESKEGVRPLFGIANKFGQKLAEQFGADKDIVMLGTLFMDIKRKQAQEEGRIDEHIQMGLEVAHEFFGPLQEISKEGKEKIYNCIAAHHGDIPFTCLEAEVCANADCYKFLHPKGIFIFLRILTERGKSLEESLNYLEEKMDEKWKTLSLDACKEELSGYYHDFKRYIALAKN